MGTATRTWKLWGGILHPGGAGCKALSAPQVGGSAGHGIPGGSVTWLVGGAAVQPCSAAIGQFLTRQDMAPPVSPPSAARKGNLSTHVYSSPARHDRRPGHQPSVHRQMGSLWCIHTRDSAQLGEGTNPPRQWCRQTRSPWRSTASLSPGPRATSPYKCETPGAGGGGGGPLASACGIAWKVVMKNVLWDGNLCPVLGGFLIVYNCQTHWTGHFICVRSVSCEL